MARVSATFKPSVARLAQRYAIFNEVSFSEAVGILTSTAGLKWWMELSKKQQKEVDEKIDASKIKSALNKIEE